MMNGNTTTNASINDSIMSGSSNNHHNNNEECEGIAITTLEEITKMVEDDNTNNDENNNINNDSKRVSFSSTPNFCTMKEDSQQNDVVDSNYEDDDINNNDNNNNDHGNDDMSDNNNNNHKIINDHDKQKVFKKKMSSLSSSSTSSTITADNKENKINSVVDVDDDDDDDDDSSNWSIDLENMVKLQTQKTDNNNNGNDDQCNDDDDNDDDISHIKQSGSLSLNGSRFNSFFNRDSNGNNNNNRKPSSIMSSSTTNSGRSKMLKGIHKTFRSVKTNIKGPTKQRAIGLRHGLTTSWHGSDTNKLMSTNQNLSRELSRGLSRGILNKKDTFNITTRKLKLYNVEDQELEARNNCIKHPLKISWYNLVAAARVFMQYFITLESVFTSLLSAGLTIWYWLDLQSGTTNLKDGSMDRILLTFAVITPISVSVRMAFNRRERALVELAKFRSFAFQVYVVHCTWDWKYNGGRKNSNIDWLEHTDTVMSHLIGIGDELKRFLTLPTSSRGRHRFTTGGRKEAMVTLEVAFRLFDSLYTQRFIRLTYQTEELKTNGLSETECSRCRQYERYMGEAVENLRLLKSYRTPEALRTFARIFVAFLPPLYAPSFAQLGYNLNSLGIGITFAIITAVGLSALFESVEVLEDPFVGYTELDGIDVEEELDVLHWQQLVNAREVYFPDAFDYPSESEPALHATLKNVRKPPT